MPTVRTETIGFNGGQITRVIKVDRKGIFSITLPQALWQRLGIQSRIEGEDLQTVLNEWDRLVDEFTKASTTTRKVIIYRLEVTARIFRDDPHAPILNESDVAFTHGLALDFAAGVFMEETTKLEGRESKTYYPEDSSIPYGSALLTHIDRWSKYPVIEWTPEREEFFANVVNSFETLILRIHSFLGEDSTKKLLNLIDSGANLLTTGQQEEK